MPSLDVLRGVKAGAAAGLVFGAFVALVGNPLVGYAETFESGGHGGGPAVSGVVTAIVSVAGGVLLGVLLGAVVFGLGFYLLEPAIPGTGGVKSYLLAAAGFITISGAPWLVLPPQPPGVEQALSTRVRITWYLIMMAVGALTCGLSGAVYNRLRATVGVERAVVGALVPFGLVFGVPSLAPANPVSGPITGGVADLFRAVTVTGQLGLWFVLASVHAWLGARGTEERADGNDRRDVDEPPDRTPSG